MWLPSNIPPQHAPEDKVTQSQLNAWAQNSYALSLSEAASVGYTGVFTGDAKGHQSVFVGEVSRYVEIAVAGGRRERWGVALRLVVSVTDFDGAVSLTL